MNIKYYQKLSTILKLVRQPINGLYRYGVPGTALSWRSWFWDLREPLAYFGATAPRPPVTTQTTAAFTLGPSPASRVHSSRCCYQLVLLHLSLELFVRLYLEVQRDLSSAVLSQKETSLFKNEVF